MHAPYVARAVAAQIRFEPPLGRDLGSYRATLAGRLNGDACPGAHGLTDEERAYLGAIAAGRG
jgi:hypothetical protein